MLDYFVEGGTPFMGLLTIMFFLMIIQSVRTVIRFSGGSTDYEELKRMTDYVRSIGVLALVVGILGQLLGLYGAFEYIQEVGAVSQTMLVSGIKVSMITNNTEVIHITFNALDSSDHTSDWFNSSKVMSSSWSDVTSSSYLSITG